MRKILKTMGREDVGGIPFLVTLAKAVYSTEGWSGVEQAAGRNR